MARESDRRRSKRLLKSIKKRRALYKDITRAARLETYPCSMMDKAKAACKLYRSVKRSQVARESARRSYVRRQPGV